MTWQPALAMAGAVALAACGGSSAGSGGGSSGGTSSCSSISELAGTVDDHGSSVATGSSLSLVADDFYFQPTCVKRVPPGTVTVTIKNTGKTLHNISVAEQGIDTDVPIGQTVTVRLATATSPVVFVCKYHRNSGMEGALVPGTS